MDWISKTWISKTWISKTWISKTWTSKTWISKTWISKTWTDMVLFPTLVSVHEKTCIALHGFVKGRFAKHGLIMGFA